MKKGRRNNYLNIIITVIMAACVTLILMFTYEELTKQAVEDCYANLWEETDQMRDDLRRNVDGDTRLLETMSQLLTELPQLDQVHVQSIIRFEQAGNLLEGVELLLPDGTMIGAEDGSAVGEGLLDYETEMQEGDHFTGRIQVQEGVEEWVLYHIVPVVRDGEIAALLCGRMNLTQMRTDYCNNLLDNGSRFHLLEGQSKEFLVDTSHATLGVAEMGNRTVQDGNSESQLNTDMSEGRSGEIIFFSKTAQEFLYCVYEPVGIGDWMVMLGVPESVAFHRVTMVKMFCLGCAIMEALVLFVYFMILLYRNRKITDELEKQYHYSRQLVQIQELLFHSVLHPERMTKALEKTAELLTAKCVYLFTEHCHGGIQCYHSTMASEQYILKEQDIPELCHFLQSGKNMYFSDLGMLEVSEAEKGRLRAAEIHNGMGILLKDINDQCRGILLAVNLTQKWEDAEPMEGMRFAFSMTLDSMEAFQRIRDLGSKDQLTGLLNRNSYQVAMEFYEKMGEDSLICIYLDVDGLHELNNQFGHASGDRMLKTISRLLQEVFGAETAYRIGGDEFLIFCCGSDETQMEQKLETLQKSIIDAGYHVSMGMASRKDTPLVYEMVRRAEGRMYEAKRRFYREQKNGQKVREMNRQLEASLLEKRDLDAFCSVLVYKYIGVYIVNLSRDQIRAINIPDYFARQLEQAGGKFSKALACYTEEMVAYADREEFRVRIDLDEVFRHLSKGEKPEIYYNRMDGMRLHLKIYPTPDFDEFQKECIWTFEVVGEADGKADLEG